MNGAGTAAGLFFYAAVMATTACTDRTAPSEGHTGSGDASIGGMESTSSSSTSATSTTDSTGPVVECIVELGPDPDADPNNWGGGPDCALQTESSCSDQSQPSPCTPLYGRRLGECAGDGIPACESPTSLAYLGCITFTICKPGVNFYSDGHDTPTYYVTTNGCIPYGFERADVPALDPDTSDDSLPPTCGDWW